VFNVNGIIGLISLFLHSSTQTPAVMHGFVFTDNSSSPNIIITMENVIFTEKLFAGTRVYYFDAREDVKGDPYLQIVEAPTEGGKGTRKRIFIHDRDFAKFKETLGKVFDQWQEHFGANVNKS